MRRALGVGAVVLLLALPAMLGPAHGAQRFVLGIVSPTPSVLPIWIAHEQGFVRDEGLTVQLVTFSGSRVTIQALVAQEVGAVAIAAPAVANAVLAGTDAVMIAGFDNFMPYYLAARGMKSLLELKGKVIGIAAIGGTTDFLIRLLLPRIGLDPARDVTLLQLGGEGQRVAALESGGVQATPLSVLFMGVAQRRFGAVPLFDFSTLQIPYQHTGLATTRAQLRDHRPTLQRLMRAVVRGIHVYKTNPGWSEGVAMKYLKLEDRELARMAVVYHGTRTLRAPYVNLPGVKTVLDELARTNPRARTVKPEDLADQSLVREIEAEGLIRRLYGG
ncbi:MAG: ABC transporter substrate-binding protein [Deltaproteobacteria bacterium]|nr:ABC transporter substrate-binding protein [Deltaproteobacteria bacterium]